jgi:hypothetical protein
MLLLIQANERSRNRFALYNHCTRNDFKRNAFPKPKARAELMHLMPPTARRLRAFPRFVRIRNNHEGAREYMRRPPRPIVMFNSRSHLQRRAKCGG